MIEDKTVLAVIAARGGSKGIARKNVKKIAGKPLIAWTINEAKKSAYIDRLVLSSDDDEIIRVAKRLECEVPFRRPSELSQDDTPAVDVVLHALCEIGPYDVVLLLQPTSPLRLAEDIDGCLERFVTVNAPSCVSLSGSEKSLYWSYTLSEAGLLKPLIIRKIGPSIRQNLPSIYTLNGAIYIAYTDWLKKKRTFITHETTGYVMPRERSIDIDDLWQLELCEVLLKLRNKARE